jgi:heptosyltransferase-1
MKKILLVKTSSLGDVVHNLPVVSDIARRYPGARIDWVVEEGFAALPALHPAVTRVIPVAVRRWRKAPLGRDTWREVGAVRRLFAAEPYDIVVDTQGLIKSALIARSADGERHGYNARSAREPLAARLYDVTHAVPRNLHAVVRNRALAAAALHYRVEDGVDYGIGLREGEARLEGGETYCVLLHATSRADKHWAEAHWTDLGQRLAAAGLQCLLPWGSAAEFTAAGRLAAAIPGARVAPKLDLTAMARLIAGAGCVVGVDTGLTHLSAALGRPTVAIFCASSSLLTGVYGASAACNLGAPGAPPGVDAVLAALNGVWPGRSA